MSELNRTILYKIAALADVDPRTVARYFEPPHRAISALATNAIRCALLQLGIADPRATVPPHKEAL